MTDRDALFAAICANPDDDTARLVFADWLDENGEGKRAAYTRAAVEEWRRENADNTATTMNRFLDCMKFYTGGRAFLDRVDWSPRAPELVDIYRFEKARTTVRFPRLTMATGLPKIRGVRFDLEDVGGFFNEVIVTNPAAFLANADAIFRAAPIYYLNFQGKPLTAEQAREFVAAGHLARIRWLRFYAIEPKALRVLGDHRDAAGVKRIQLYCTPEAAEQVEQLAAGSHWTGLTQLVVTNLHLAGDENTNDIAVQLLRSPGFRRLRELFLFSNTLGDEAARAIATGGFTELRRLDLSLNNIGTEGATALAESKTLPNLQYLEFHRNRACGAEGISRLIASPKLKSLTALRLWASSNDSGGIDPKILAKPSRGPMLRALELECGALSTAALTAFAKCPALHGLWFLSLRASVIHDAGIRALTRGKGFRELTVLDLANNMLTPKGVEALANWHAPLQALNLLENKVGAAGAKAIIAAEHLQGLKRLLVTGRGATQLQKHFGKRVVP